MGAEFRLPDDLLLFVQRQVVEGRHATEAEVVEVALRRYADEVAIGDVTDEMLRAAAVEGIADIEAGRFVEIKTAGDVVALRRRLKTRRAANGDRHRLA